MRLRKFVASLVLAVIQAALLALALWTIGACLGIVWVGFKMVAGS